jgi:hypothetical protein
MVRGASKPSWPRSACAAALAIVCLAAGTAPPAFDPRQSDPRAVAIADLVMAALGGQRAWDETRYLRFAFAVDKGQARVAYRTHLWDRWDGRLRFETTGKDGVTLVVLLNVRTREGEAYRGAKKLETAEAKPVLEEAYEAWINDSYWLLMPYKMRDPGVRLQYAGEETRNGDTYDRVLLSFNGVGLTPGDRYWAFINRKTHLMDRWSYILQDDPPGREPTVWDWKSWTRYGRILLAPEKVSERKDGLVRISHPILQVYETLADLYFSRPDPLPERLEPRAGG